MCNFNMSYLGVMVDMAGCPNRCRHCWLGNKKNGHMSIEDFKSIAAQFKEWRDENGQGIGEMSFYSWWREPDYRDDYRELWEIEQTLSSPGRAKRFELLSTWRLSRDEEYAKWAATLRPKVCQITFFGMEDNTDWGMRRRGAFRDQLAATKRCLDVGITPRWQLFLTKRCLGELHEFLRLMKEYNITNFFVGGISPEGCGYEIEDERLEAVDLQLIPKEISVISSSALNYLGQPECDLITEMRTDNTIPNMSANFPCVSVDVDYNVYPNIAEPAEWWRLGNLKNDGVDIIMKAYRDGTTPGMTANRTISVSELACRFGDKNSTKLYTKDDLICRFMHQWGENYIKNGSYR